MAGARKRRGAANEVLRFLFEGCCTRVQLQLFTAQNWRAGGRKQFVCPSRGTIPELSKVSRANHFANASDNQNHSNHILRSILFAMFMNDFERFSDIFWKKILWLWNMVTFRSSLVTKSSIQSVEKMFETCQKC